MSFDELWLAYFALGGTALPHALRSYLGGTATPSIDYDVLAQAINEGFVERGGNHPVPYSEDLRLGEVRPIRIIRASARAVGMRASGKLPSSSDATLGQPAEDHCP